MTLTLAGVMKSVSNTQSSADTNVYRVLLNCLELVRSYGPKQTKLGAGMTLICDLDFS